MLNVQKTKNSAICAGERREGGGRRKWKRDKRARKSYFYEIYRLIIFYEIYSPEGGSRN